MKWKYKGKHWDVINNSLILYFDCLIGHKSVEIDNEVLCKSGMTEKEFITEVVKREEREIYSENMEA
jgi:hypothetical protein